MSKYNLNKEKDTLELEELRAKAKNPLCYALAVRINDCLKELGMSQQELAERSECSTGSISSYLKAKTEPKVEYLLNISKVLNVSTDYLLGAVDIKSPEINNIAIHKKLGLSDGAIARLEEYNGDVFEGKYMIPTVNFLLEQKPLSLDEAFEKWNADVKIKRHNTVLDAIESYFKFVVSKDQTLQLISGSVKEKGNYDNNIAKQYSTMLSSGEVSGESIINTVLLNDISDLLKTAKATYQSNKGGENRG